MGVGEWKGDQTDTSRATADSAHTPTYTHTHPHTHTHILQFSQEQKEGCNTTAIVPHREKHNKSALYPPPAPSLNPDACPPWPSFKEWASSGVMGMAPTKKAAAPTEMSKVRALCRLSLSSAPLFPPPHTLRPNPQAEKKRANKAAREEAERQAALEAALSGEGLEEPTTAAASGGAASASASASAPTAEPKKRVRNLRKRLDGIKKLQVRLRCVCICVGLTATAARPSPHGPASAAPCSGQAGQGRGHGGGARARAEAEAGVARRGGGRDCGAHQGDGGLVAPRRTAPP